MTSLFKIEKRNEALERIATGIIHAAKNCTTVVKKINTLCQNPEKYPNPSELIHQWHKHLFTNYFHDFIDEWTMPNIISVEDEERLSIAFFNYFASLTPIFYKNKKITSPNIGKPNMFIWTSDDYKDLLIKLFEKRHFNERIEIDLDGQFRIDFEMQETMRQIELSSKANSSFLNREKKITEIFYPDSLSSLIYKIKPDYQHQFQTDLYLKYTGEFITHLPSALIDFDKNFYEIGTFLHNYFQWAKK